jgi:SAM-dependent methyltransferase
MNLLLTSMLTCLDCGGGLAYAGDHLACCECHHALPQQQGKPVLTPVPANIVPSKKKERGANLGTVWRRANWRFYQQAAQGITTRQVVLDLGAGHADLKAIFEQEDYIAADIYPYEEIDFVCDLTVFNPLRPASVDVVILSNVLEHVLDGPTFLRSVGRTLKPGGRLLIAVPFIIKMHQMPFDFVRYTHFALDKMLVAAGFEVARIEAVYAPFFLVRATMTNLANSPQAGHGSLRHRFVRRLLAATTSLVNLMERASGNTGPELISIEPGIEINPYPLGYHIESRIGSFER